MWEVSPGALSKPRAKEMAEILKRGGYVVVRRWLLPSGKYRDEVTAPDDLIGTREVRLLIESLGGQMAC